MTPNLVIDADTFHSPAAVSTKTLRPTRIINVDGFFVHVIVRHTFTTAPYVVDADVIFAPIIGEHIERPQRVIDTDAFHAPMLTKYKTLAASLVVDADNIRIPSFNQRVTPGHVLDVDVIYAASVPVQPWMLVDADTFHTPSAAIRNVALPVLYVDADAFFAPYLAVELLPHEDTETFYVVTVARQRKPVRTSDIGRKRIYRYNGYVTDNRRYG